MHYLHNLKDKLLNELKEYSEKPSFSPADIEAVRNAISGVNKICEYTDAEKDNKYSNRMSYAYNSYDGSYDDASYARGRRGNVRRDSMGRYSRERGYSRNEDMTNKLYEVMEEAPEHLKHEVKRLMEKIEQQ